MIDGVFQYIERSLQMPVYYFFFGGGWNCSWALEEELACWGTDKLYDCLILQYGVK